MSQLVGRQPGGRRPDRRRAGHARVGAVRAESRRVALHLAVLLLLDLVRRHLLYGVPYPPRTVVFPRPVFGARTETTMRK